MKIPEFAKKPPEALVSIAKEKQHTEEYKGMWEAISDACGVPLGHFKTAGQFIDHVKTLRAMMEALEMTHKAGLEKAFREGCECGFNSSTAGDFEKYWLQSHARKIVEGI